MLKILKGRQTGKTTKIIEKSAKLQIPIIVPNFNTLHFIKERAKYLNYDIPAPFTIDQFVKKGFYRHYDNILIDNLEGCLNNLLECQIDTIAIDEGELIE